VVTAIRQASGVQRGAPPTRDPLWDNLRLLAITLVVVGHAIEATNRYDPGYSLYLFIYSFHVPLLVFISGYFTRAEPLTIRDGQRMLSQLLLPYLIFSLIWALVRWPGGTFSLDLASPYWHLWFLPALVLWRLTLPIFAALRWPVATAVAVACVSGYFGAVGWVFDGSRVLTMVPFFVAGWAVRTHPSGAVLVSVLRLRAVRLAAAALLGGALLAAILLVDQARQHHLRQWVQAERNFAATGDPSWTAGLVRLALLGAGLILVLACVSVTTAARVRVTSWGTATMYVYMLHLFPIFLLQQTNFYRGFESPLKLLVVVLGALLLSAVLSTKPVRTVARPLVEPRPRWLLADASTPTGRQASGR
jgi:fucose 4-O-acetylase-like acetyltransferase